jgi:hypothetical protein
MGFRFKIPSSPKGFAETGAAGRSFEPQATCRLSGIKNEAPTKILIRHRRIKPKDIFEVASEYNR